VMRNKVRGDLSLDMDGFYSIVHRAERSRSAGDKATLCNVRFVFIRAKSVPSFRYPSGTMSARV
jgi:hypothetical protein